MTFDFDPIPTLKTHFFSGSIPWSQFFCLASFYLASFSFKPSKLIKQLNCNNGITSEKIKYSKFTLGSTPSRKIVKAYQKVNPFVKVLFKLALNMAETIHELKHITEYLRTEMIKMNFL